MPASVERCRHFNSRCATTGKQRRRSKFSHPPDAQSVALLMRHQKSVFALLLCCAVAGCGGSGFGGDRSSSEGNGSGSSAAPPVGVTVTPTSVSVDVGTGSAAFTAAVTNAQDPTVAWYVNGVSGGNDA